MKKWSRWLALALASALALSGCGNSDTEEKPTTESEKEPTTAENQTQPEKEESKDASGKHEIKDLVTSQLVVNEMETFNMLYSQSQKEFDVLCNNWDGLLEVDPHGVPIAGIAKDWDTEDGGLTWRRKLTATHGTLLPVWSGCSTSTKMTRQIPLCLWK